MARTLRILSIIGACIIALAMVYAAFLASGEFRPQSANAASTDAVLSTLAAKDTDSDGLPDWEESIYGTNPQDAHSISTTQTDAEAVAGGLVKPKFSVAPAASTPTSVAGPTPGAGTITDEFAQALFLGYLENRGTTPPTKAEISAFVGATVKRFLLTHQPQPAYTLSAIKQVPGGANALKAYAAGIETAFAAHAVSPDKNEVDYFAEAMNTNSTAPLAEVKRIADAYTAIGKGVAATPVPSELALPHLALANALANLGRVIGDLAAVKEDPMRALLALGSYDDTVLLMGRAFADMAPIFAGERVSLTEGDAGFYAYDMIQTAQKGLSTATKP